MNNLPFQLSFRPELPAIPNIYLASDYQEFRSVLIKIDEMLHTSGLEDRLVSEALSAWLSESEDFAEGQQIFRSKILHYALRCNIARHITGESFRDFSIRLADSGLFQWFTRINGFDHKKAASKSALDRYDKFFDAEMVDEQIKIYLAELSDPVKAYENGLNDPISFSSVFMDSSCVKANIHFPVDWVCLRDAARSLILAIKTIRKQDLKHRMIDPAVFMRNMNKLCIEMTHTRRRADSKKKRKFIFRKMKNLSCCIYKHAIRYKWMLQERWQETDWTYNQAQQVIGRIDNILKQLPAAIHQAHERIIGERQVSSKDKILSLYEPDVHVIVRGKAGNEVEFGNGLLLCEQENGIITHWKLFKDQPPSDSLLLQDAIIDIERHYGPIDSACTDRGFYSKKNQEFLKAHNIYDATCPKSPKALKERLQENKFRSLQSRRGQTEARIGIFKNSFLGRPLRSKGFNNKQLSVSWCVLTHNLWVIARMALADEMSPLLKAA